jgi:hypothetical protein
MATPHPLMTLGKQNMAKKPFKLAASDSCGDVCAAECPVNGQKVLVVTVYISPNSLSDDCKSLICVQNVLSFWRGEVVTIRQSYWQVTLTSTCKIITMPNL